MSKQADSNFHVIDAYPLEQAVADGTVIPVTAPAEREPDPKPLHEITSMDGYLQNYGRILGKKAITALAPLHVPGRDPLPDFDDLLREPFDCQKHVVAAGIQMLDNAGSGFIVGEMGCIAGESEVYDPVAGQFRRVDQITEPFHVVSYHDGRAVIGKATRSLHQGSARPLPHQSVKW